MKLPRKLTAAGGALALAAALVTPFEGRSLVAYLDPVGIPTICEGITAGVRMGDMATPAECDALLKRELQRAVDAVDRQVLVPLPDTRRAALASFVYNVGEGQLARSTLLRKLNAGDVRGACAELSRWVYAGGKKLGGLVRRRAAERELCEVGL
ncbi:lysozyme [Pseudomonas aeruginosa]|uniref:lysozyme n=2 Tax=Pseudomonas aeruginosa TaxID=287 RepID=UPI001EEE7A09|nr:lysozyme [Pseudomonas aeruginosa]MCG7012761.1 lysozyme [Pseudomonas aeruginosa]HDP4777317.1 lysozyme [Pseudomonas aeruginosa]